MNRYSFLVTLLILIICEGLITLLEVPSYLLPLPSKILLEFWTSKNDLLAALLETSKHTTLALFFSSASGLVLAVLISLSPWLRAGILPLAQFFQTVPIIAIAPMLVIWFGFGAPTVIASATIVSFFPILASALQGIESTPKSSLELFKLYKANRIQTYLKLKLPLAIPWFLNGLRISVGLAVIGALVGEFIGGGGLGSLIDSARTQQRTELVFAAVFGSCAIGWILTLALDLLQHTLLKKWLQN
ncbi:MAG: hypothetical protein RJB66_965 [Pseudomonadota bacterium]|jgi:NitT/TauT family transport system permease protein